MKFLLTLFMFFTSNAQASLPWNSYQCTSTARFFEKDVFVKEDQQTVTAGFVSNSNVGIKVFHHQYLGDQLMVHTGIDIGVGSYIGSTEEFSDATYFHFAKANFPPKVVDSSRFESLNAELPEKFALTLNNANVAPNIIATLRVVCTKN